MTIHAFDLDLVIERMQDAVDVVLSSEHETSKVAACLFHPDGDLLKKIACTNHRPQVLADHFSKDMRVGKSSQFVHAEAACVLEYDHSAAGHFLCVTDPFCPNCAKVIVESGVTHVFIDHKGMEKDFVKRRGGAFQQISLKIAEAAGLHVFVLSRKAKSLEVLVQPTAKKAASQLRGVYEQPIPLALEGLSVSDILRQAYKNKDICEAEWYDNAHALCVARNKDGQFFLMISEEALTDGLDEAFVSSVSPDDTDKYRFEVDAFNKLYLAMKYREYDLADGVVLSNHRPSSRALVNGLLAGLSHVIVDDRIKGHDPLAHEAQKVMESIGAISFDYMS